MPFKYFFPMVCLNMIAATQLWLTFGSEIGLTSFSFGALSIIATQYLGETISRKGRP